MGISVLPPDKEETVENGELTEALYKPSSNELTSGKKTSYQSLELDEQNDCEEPTSWFLYCSSFTADLLIFVAGIAMSFTSPVIPKLHSEESPLNEPITTLQISILTSILGCGKLIGPFMFSKLADKIGRRWTLYAISVPMAVGMLILAFATDVRLYYVARLLTGAGAGGSFAIVSTYNGEIAQHKNRGILGCLVALFLSFGTFFPYAVGPHLSIKWFSLSCLSPLILFYIIAPIFIPESPMYSTKIHDYKTAKQSLQKIRGRNANIDKEFLEIQEFVNETREQEVSYIEMFRSAKLRKPLILGLSLAVLQQMTGVGVVIGYLEPILSNTGLKSSLHWATIAVGLTKIGIVFVTSSLVESKGRRFLLIVSASGVATSSFSLALYIFLYTRHYAIAEYIWWVPIVALILYVMFFNFGLGPILWAWIGEVFPANIRATASAMVTATCFAFSALVTFLFPIVQVYLGTDTAFFTYSFFSAMGLIFAYFFVPETKGLTMSEIQDMWVIKRRMSMALS